MPVTDVSKNYHFPRLVKLDPADISSVMILSVDTDFSIDPDLDFLSYSGSTLLAIPSFLSIFYGTFEPHKP